MLNQKKFCEGRTNRRLLAPYGRVASIEEIGHNFGAGSDYRIYLPQNPVGPLQTNFPSHLLSSHLSLGLAGPSPHIGIRSPLHMQNLLSHKEPPVQSTWNKKRSKKWSGEKRINTFHKKSKKKSENHCIQRGRRINCSKSGAQGSATNSTQLNVTSWLFEYRPNLLRSVALWRKKKKLTGFAMSA